MKVLDNLKYTENHEWVLLENNVAIIGITDYAQNELGDIVFVDINTLGEELSFDDVFGSVEAVKTVSDLYMPITGKIIELNNNLETEPELVNNSPYEAGWIIKVEIDNNSQINDKLMTSDQYKKHIGL